MLHRATQLIGRLVVGEDGEVGKIEDLYFDDQRWAVRHLVVRTGNWLNGRSVLVPPGAVRRDLSSEQAIRVSLSKAQVEGSPPVDADRPVSRHYEIAHALYYRYAPYWSGPLLWGNSDYPLLWSIGGLSDSSLPVMDQGVLDAAQAEIAAAQESHLRSAKEVTGYGVEAVDGRAGRIDDLMVDDQDWAIRYLVVDTRTWLPGGEVLVPATEVQSVEWAGSTVHVRQDRETIRHEMEAY